MGDTLEYHLTMKDTNAAAPGAFWFAMDFSSGVPVKEQTLEVRVPREFSLLVKSKKAQPVVKEDGGERVYRWKHETASEYPKKRETDKTAEVNTVQEVYEPDVAMTSFHSWAELGAWYRGLMKGRATPDAAIQAKADELTRGLTTDDAKVDALYNYVSTQYRYIAVSFGIGRLQPHTAAEVFRDQYGDCKDKHTLLQAMLAAEKIDAEPVLIGSEVRVNEALPMPSQFDHMITLVKLKDHDVWLDSTPEVSPSRMLMSGLRDKLALAIPATGDARLIRTEPALPFPSFMRETITGKLAKGGVLTAHFDLTLRGDAEVIYRSLFHSVPRAQWQELAQRISYNNGFAGEVSAVDASLPEKTAEPFHLSWDYTRKDFGDSEHHRIPGLSTWFETKIADDATAPKRVMAMDPTTETEVKVTLTLPEDEAVTPPADVNRSTAFADYISKYSVKDREFTMDRTLRYKVRELSANEFDDYRTFLRAVSDDASQMIQLVPFHISRNPNVVTNVPAVAVTHPEAGDGASWFKAVQAKLQAGDVGGASSLLDEVKQVNDHERYLWVAFGDVEWRLANMTAAADDYNKEIELHPDIGMAYRRLAQAYSMDGEWANVEGAERSWCKANPKDEDAQKTLGSTLMMLERFRESADAYQAAADLSLDADALKVELGRAQLKSGQIDAGKATLHAVIDHTSDVMIANNAAYQLGDANVDLDTAEKASLKSVKALEAKCSVVKFDSATDDDLHNVNELAENWDTLGWIFFRQHRLPEAEAYVRSAWLLDAHAEMGLHLAQIYETEHETVEAIATYRQAASILSAKHPWPFYAHMKQQMLARASTLESTSASATNDDAEAEPPGLRSYAIPSPINGGYAHAEFLLLLSDDRAESVRFLRGDEKLKPASEILQTLTYRSPLPPRSNAKILRRGTLTCAMGATTCELRLASPAKAKVND